MDRCALFVDASYALADGAMAVHGTRRRDSVSWNHAGLLTLLAGLAKDRTGLPVLRCYWYETAAEGVRTPEQDALAEMPGLKLRLVNARPGRREGIETPLRRDLVTLAKNGAISDAFVASADEHLAEIVTEVQDLGLRVVILHISSDGGWTIPQPLRQECDDIVEISGVHLRPFVELVRGAEPMSADELRGPGASDALVGPPPGQVRALPAPPAQAALYASADSQLLGPQLPGAHLAGDSLAANPAPAGQSAHPGMAAAADNGAYAGAGQGGPGQGGPGQGGLVPLAPGYLNGAGRGGASAQQPTSGDGYPGGTQYGPVISGLADLATGPSRNGMNRADYPSAAAHNGSADHGTPMSNGVPMPNGRPMSNGGPMPNGVPMSNGVPMPNGRPMSNGGPPSRPENGSSTGYHAQPPTGYATGPGGAGVPAGGYQTGNLQPLGSPPGGLLPPGSQGDNGRNGSGSYGAPPDGSGQAPVQQNGSVSPGGPAAISPQNGSYQLGPPVQQGLSYQNGALQAGPLPTGPIMHSGPAPSGPPQGPGQGDPMRGPAQAGLSQSGPVQPGQIGSGPGQAGHLYPAPVAPYVIPPSHAPMVGTVFGSQGQYSQSQSGPGALVPARVMQPVAVPLPEAVQAAHAEGFSFGESVGRDAPGLWLDAVLARKPRMPSDLEARLLQGSALPIDSLLHDEVRHSLRRGFWDALEGARR